MCSRNVFQQGGMQSWVSTCVRMINDVFDPTNFFDTLYQDLTPVIEDGAFQRLYGNCDKLLADGGCGNVDYVYMYAVENIGKLSDKVKMATPPLGLR